MNKILVMLKKEMKETFRDKKTISMMLIIPFLIPIIIFGMSALFNMETNKNVNVYNKIGFAYKLSDSEKEIAKNFNIKFKEGLEKDLEQLFKDKEIYLYITKDNNTYIIHGDDSSEATYAQSLVEDYFGSYKEYLQNNYLQENNVNPDEVINIINLDYDIKQKDDFVVKYMLSYAFMFLIMAITVASTYPATDATAGEKERGTLETLLTFPINNRDILVGKYLSISLICVITGLVSLVLIAISVPIANSMFAIYDSMPLVLSLVDVLYILLVIILCSFMVSGLTILVASRCKTFKEAQSALTPITFIALFPAMIAQMTGVTNSLLKSAIPFLNFSMIFDDLTSGKPVLVNILIMVLSTCLITYLLIKTNIKKYKSEKVLF